MMVADGDETFLIGSYHLPKVENPYQVLAENGYNLVHLAAEQQALDAAGRYGLKGWLTTGCITEENRDKDRKRISDMVRGMKNHPAFLCWEIVDEPAFTWNSAEQRKPAELVIETYELIKHEDPDHLVYTNHGPVNLVSTLQKYNPGTDIIACDVYPVIPHGIKPSYALFPDGLQGDLLNPYLSQVGEYAEKMHRVSGHSKPLIMVLQGFAWEMLKEEDERDPAMIQYPTFEESRFMAYNAVIHGAIGINYWGVTYTPQPSPFMDDLNRLTRELAGVRHVLSARTLEMRIEKTYHELGYSVDTGVEILAKLVDGVTYLITANSDKNPVRVSLSRLDAFKTAVVLNEDRTISTVSGELTDDYKPFDVHVYRLE
jgi:hypothetical protein